MAKDRAFWFSWFSRVSMLILVLGLGFHVLGDKNHYSLEGRLVTTSLLLAMFGLSILPNLRVKLPEIRLFGLWKDQAGSMWSHN